MLDIQNINKKEDTKPVNLLVSDNFDSTYTGKPHDILNKHLGKIENGKFYQFYSSGRFSMTDVMLHILKQIGPAHILCGTWSVSMESIDQLVKLYKRGGILSLSFVLDPRVKVTKAKPLQMIKANFPLVFKPWHAKVTTMQNNDWNISIVSSQNMTQNPKIERGCIFTDNATFEFDKKVLEHELNILHQ